MPGKKKVKKAVSKAQARLFGAIATGSVKKEGFSPAEAKRKLKGVNVKKLPSRKKPKEKKA